MFERILVTTDFSANSLVLLELALAVARSFDSRILLLHVDEEERLLSLGRTAELVRFLDEVEVRRSAALDRLAQRIEEAGVEVEQVRRRGTASDEILSVARKREVDLIAISTVGLETTKPWLIGSTAKKVLRYSPCPVLLTNHYCSEAIAPLLREKAPWGGDLLEQQRPPAEEQGEEPRREGTGPAEPRQQTPPLWPPIERILSPVSIDRPYIDAVRFAAGVAGSMQAALELLYVLKVPSFFPSLPGEPPLSLPHELVAGFQEEAGIRLAEMANAVSQQRVDWTVTIASDEAQEITGYAARSGANMVILPRRAHSRLGELLFGRVSSAVAKTSPVPLLVYVDEHERPATPPAASSGESGGEGGGAGGRQS